MSPLRLKSSSTIGSFSFLDFARIAFASSSVPIVVGKKLVGIITNRDLKFETDETKLIKDSMT